MSTQSSTGSATPSSLYKLYKECGAVAANPCTLRRQFSSVDRPEAVVRLNLLGLKRGLHNSSGYAPVATVSSSAESTYHIHRHSSPPKISLKQLPNVNRRESNGSNVRTVSLTLASLDMNRR